MTFRIMNEDRNTKFKGYSCFLKVSHHHNHQTNSLPALSHRNVSKKTKDKVMHLYSQRHTPATALRKMKNDLANKCCDNSDINEFEFLMADRAHILRRNDMLYLYTQYNQNLFGGKNGSSLFSCLEEKINEYNSVNASAGGKMKHVILPSEDDSEITFAVAIVTPLMF